MQGFRNCILALSKQRSADPLSLWQGVEFAHVHKGETALKMADDRIVGTNFQVEINDWEAVGSIYGIKYPENFR